MTSEPETAPKRSVGMVTWIFITLVFYILSFAPAYIGVLWLVHWGLPRQPAIVCFSVAYAPVAIAAEMILPQDTIRQIDRMMNRWAPR